MQSIPMQSWTLSNGPTAWGYQTSSAMGALWTTSCMKCYQGGRSNLQIWVPPVQVD